MFTNIEAIQVPTYAGLLLVYPSLYANYWETILFSSEPEAFKVNQQFNKCTLSSLSPL
jgi:hypothetical protein